MPKSKEEFLLCAENAIKYINQIGDGGFVGFILDMIDFVAETNQPDVKKLQTLWEILYNVKSSDVEFLSGGNRLRRAYVEFIEKFLGISGGGDGYRINNREFGDLTLDELHYVFGWVRRLLKAQSGSDFRSADDKKIAEHNNRIGDNKRPNKNISHDGKNQNHKNFKNDNFKKGQGEFFNTQMQEQLKNWNKKNKNERC